MLLAVARLLFALVALGGCTLVFNVEPLPGPGKLACGPYGAPTPVAFSAALMTAGAHDLSVTGDGTLGAVVVDVDNVPSTRPVMLDGSQTWIDDPAGFASTLTGTRGHRVASDTMLLTSAANSHHEVDTYKLAATGWAQIAPIVDSDPGFELYAGNESDNLQGTTVTYRRVLLVKRRTTTPHSLVVVTNFELATDPTSFHEDLNRTAPLDAATDLQPTHAVITADRKTIVYAATASGANSDLFVSTFDVDQNAWLVGDRLASLDTDGAEDEPWVNGDCSRIWFRRDGVVYEAQAQ